MRYLGLILALALLFFNMGPAVAVRETRFSEAKELFNEFYSEYSSTVAGPLACCAVLLEILYELRAIHEDLHQLEPIRNNTRELVNNQNGYGHGTGE